MRAVGVHTGAPPAGVHVAAARVTERPWAADEYLAELQNKCLKSRNSIIQRIERSLVFKDVFAKHVGEMEDHSVIGTEIGNLRAAKHRFERTAMPAGRFTMFFDAILATANHVASHRSGRAEGDDANAFLEMVDEKLVLAMAMIADAAHEGLQLTRFADDGDMDLAEAPARCADFARRLEVLFVKGECLSLPGFSKYAMDGLRRTKLVYCSDRVRGIGGPHHPEKKLSTNCSAGSHVGRRWRSARSERSSLISTSCSASTSFILGIRPLWTRAATKTPTRVCRTIRASRSCRRRSRWTSRS